MTSRAAPQIPPHTRPSARIPPRSERPEGLRRRSGIPWLRIALLSAAIVSALSWLADPPETSSDPDADGLALRGPINLQAPPPAWHTVVNPEPLYELRVALLQGIPASLSVRQHTSGAREDHLAFGDFDGNDLHLSLRILRGAQNLDPPRFYVDMVRAAAEMSLGVVRATPPAALPTKFGTAEVAEIELTGTPERVCLGLRLQHPEVSLRLIGWLCGGADKPADRQTLSCLIDSLTLNRGADDPALKVLFAQAERGRAEACPRDAPASAARGRTSLLTPEPLPVDLRRTRAN